MAGCIADRDDVGSEAAAEDGATPALSWPEVPDACRITEFGEAVVAERVGGDCADGCRQGFACCGGTICGGDCVGTPCC